MSLIEITNERRCPPKNEKGDPLRSRPSIHERFKTPVKLYPKIGSLLDLDGAAGSSNLGLDLFGFSLVDAFLDRLRSGFNQRLGFGQAELCDSADFLDDGDLVAVIASSQSPSRIESLSVGRRIRVKKAIVDSEISSSQA